MAIDIPVINPVRLTATTSNLVYTAPSTPSTTKVVGLKFNLMHDGTSTNAVNVAIHAVSTDGTYGTDTQVDAVSVSQNQAGTSKTIRLGPGGRIFCDPDTADQITVSLADGFVMS